MKYTIYEVHRNASFMKELQFRKIEKSEGKTWCTDITRQIKKLNASIKPSDPLKYSDSVLSSIGVSFHSVFFFPFLEM